MRVVQLGKALTTTMMFLFVGCMSIEERLASNDPEIRKGAELELIRNSRQTGTEADRVAAIQRVKSIDLLTAVAIMAEPAKEVEGGVIPSTLPDGMAALEKISDQIVLATVASSAESKEIRIKAGERISDENLLMTVYENAPDVEVRAAMLKRMPAKLVRQIKYNTDLIPFWRKVTDQRTLALIYRDGNTKLSQEECEALAEKIINESVLEEMVTAPTREELQRERHQKDIEKDIKITNEERAALAVVPESQYVQREEAKTREFKAQADKLPKVLQVAEAEGSSFLYVGNEAGRVRLYRKINEARLIAMAKERVASQSFEDWNYENIDGFLAATEMLPFLGDEIGQVAYSILAKLYNFRAKCYGGLLFGYTWGEKDHQMAQTIEERVAAVLDDDIIASYIMENPRAWRTLAGMIKDRSAASELAAELIEMARRDGNDEKIKECLKECGSALEDKQLIKLAVDTPVIRRAAFDLLKTEDSKEAALVAIKDKLNAELKSIGGRQNEYAQLTQEIISGALLVRGFKERNRLTELQFREMLRSINGKPVVLKGEVLDVGQNTYSGATFVSLRVAKTGVIGNFNVTFEMADSQLSEVKGWAKGESRVLRGKFEKANAAVCVAGDVVQVGQYDAAMSLLEEANCIRWQLAQIEKEKAPPEELKPSSFMSGVATAIDWIKNDVGDIGDAVKKVGGAAATLGSSFKNAGESLDASGRMLDAASRGDIGAAFKAGIESMKKSSQSLQDAGELLKSVGGAVEDVLK